LIVIRRRKAARKILMAQDGKKKAWCCSLLQKKTYDLFTPSNFTAAVSFQSRCRYDIHKLHDKSNLEHSTRVEKGMSRHHSSSCYTCYGVSLSHQQFGHEWNENENFGWLQIFKQIIQKIQIRKLKQLQYKKHEIIKGVTNTPDSRKISL
jgi:hypothetical protein